MPFLQYSDKLFSILDEIIFLQETENKKNMNTVEYSS